MLNQNLDDKLAESAMERSQLYGRLAAVFREAPTQEAIALYRAEGIRAELEQSGVLLGDAFFTDPLNEVAEGLAEEFTRLFLGPGHHISPHESVQLERGSGVLWGAETGVVKRFMEEAGFELADSVTLLPDHIAVELEFLEHLTGEEANAWRRQEQRAAMASLNWQRNFLKDHLGKWVESFADKVKKTADWPYYEQMALLTRDFILSEVKGVEQRLLN